MSGYELVKGEEDSVGCISFEERSICAEAIPTQQPELLAVHHEHMHVQMLRKTLVLNERLVAQVHSLTKNIEDQ